MIKPKLVKIVLEGNLAQRMYIFNHAGGFPYFCIYYFPEYFGYKRADFHWDMDTDLDRLLAGEIDFLIWMMFRESAKTTLAKMFACYCACFKKKHYINFDSYEKENAISAMFDITLWFQTNERIIADFGHLYYEETGRKKKKTIKRSESFITTNGVKFEAFSTQETTRGRVYETHRPDLFIVDDFESNKTKRSAPITRGIMSHLDEMFSGLSTDGQVIFLCNYITESGTVQYILNKAKEDKRFHVRRVDAEITTPKGTEPAWPAKHVMSDEEADATNAGIEDKSRKVVSLEQKKRTLNAGGRHVYETEMLNRPEASGQLVFDRTKIDADLVKCKEPKEDRAGFKIWADYNPSHRYAIGGDVAKGVGRDSCASTCIDFTPIPALVVGTYANNEIGPDIFAHELKREGYMFGGCLLAPEVNNQGHATVNELKHIYPIDKIYRQVQTGKTIKVGEKLSTQLGFETMANKTDIIYNLKTAYEAGHLIIYDRRLLLEMRAYNQDDLADSSFDPETTRHFDLLMATSICWAMKNYALVSEAEVEDNYVQPPYEASEFEGGAHGASDPHPVS